MPQECPRALPAGLYAITPENLIGEALVEATAAVIRGGARVVQYRAKQGSRDQKRLDAQAVVDCCRAAGACSIVNDCVELAVQVGADGVHLGEHDGAIAAARALLGPDKIIGVSCYDRWENAAAALSSGADYIAFGAFFPSRSKQTDRRASLDLLRHAASLGHRAVAIGGIRIDNAPPLVAAGAHCLAVIDAVWNADDRQAAARAFAALFTGTTDSLSH